MQETYFMSVHRTFRAQTGWEKNKISFNERRLRAFPNYRPKMVFGMLIRVGREINKDENHEK